MHAPLQLTVPLVLSCEPVAPAWPARCAAGGSGREVCAWRCRPPGAQQAVQARVAAEALDRLPRRPTAREGTAELARRAEAPRGTLIATLNFALPKAQRLCAVSIAPRDAQDQGNATLIVVTPPQQSSRGRPPSRAPSWRWAAPPPPLHLDLMTPPQTEQHVFKHSGPAPARLLGCGPTTAAPSGRLAVCPGLCRRCAVGRGLHGHCPVGRHALVVIVVAERELGGEGRQERQMG